VGRLLSRPAAQGVRAACGSRLLQSIPPLFNYGPDAENGAGGTSRSDARQ